MHENHHRPPDARAVGTLNLESAQLTCPSSLASNILSSRLSPGIPLILMPWGVLAADAAARSDDTAAGRTTLDNVGAGGATVAYTAAKKTEQRQRNKQLYLQYSSSNVVS